MGDVRLMRDDYGQRVITIAHSELCSGELKIAIRRDGKLKSP